MGLMIEVLLKQEAKEREAEQAAAAKRNKVVADKRKEFESLNMQALKELCETKGLKTGGTKPDKVDRLMADVTEKGEIDSILAAINRAERRDALSDMSKEDLVKVCNEAKIDPIVKEVMIERILVHEAGLTM